MVPASLPVTWSEVVGHEFDEPYFVRLSQFIANERQQHTVFPPERDVFRALQLTARHQVKVVILGQDPYHDVNQAHGLSFSVRPDVPLPPSLRNIFRELHDDLGVPPSRHGFLEAWARQGVLLLNTVLTVRAHQANSHRRQGWEQFTDRLLQCINRGHDVAFVLWGNQAREKSAFLDERHLIIQSAHPSPLSARRGFFGSRPFSRINTFLEQHNQTPVNWELPAMEDMLSVSDSL